MGQGRSFKGEDIMSTETKKLAELLRTSEDVILKLEKRMNKISRKSDVISKIVQNNDFLARKKLIELGFGKKEEPFDANAEDVYSALIKRAKKEDATLFKYFYKPDFSNTAGCRSLINTANELAGNPVGFYLKEEAAKKLLKLNPPQKIMQSLGYGDNIDKMLKKENLFEIFAALRFIEDGKWLNDVFFKPYKDLKKEDFEEREIKVMAMSEKWKGIGKEFLGKKLHHMSHLKELGLVFIIPVERQVKGEILYLFFMTLHYIYETDWHSKLFKSYSEDKDFMNKVTNALKVEVTSDPLPSGEKASWRMVPKYLAKHDINDPRLAEPHINPESWHYTKAAEIIRKFAKRFEIPGLNFWNGLDVVVDSFPINNSKEKALISFDLFDNGISLLQKKEFKSRYFYHQQESLWNKIFIEYMGENELDKIMIENLNKGYISL
ncbi:hypothetical protein KKH96_00920 [Patescibacteria group bacterium]|nr:hypothetical protein [Patescibacteria group bacterium]